MSFEEYLDLIAEVLCLFFIAACVAVKLHQLAIFWHTGRDRIPNKKQEKQKWQIGNQNYNKLAIRITTNPGDVVLKLVYNEPPPKQKKPPGREFVLVIIIFVSCKVSCKVFHSLIQTRIGIKLNQADYPSVCCHYSHKHTSL